MTRNRWVIAAAGTIAMICLGAVYAWSVFTQPLVAAFGWSNTTTTWAFALAILFLGVGAVAGGRWQDRVGPRRVAVVGVVLWGLGNVLAGLGTARLGPTWLYLSYGVVGGLGLGLGYVTPVATVAKWFPERRGLGTGMVVMGFGLGAFVYGNALQAVPAFADVTREAAQRLADGGGARLSAAGVNALMTTLVTSGIAFAVVGGLCASLLRNPPQAAQAGASAEVAEERSAGQALRTPQFWALWLMLFLNVTAGILFISNAVPIMRELTGAAPSTALGIYGGIAVFNGLGRFFWGAVSDRIGRSWAYILVYGTQVLIFFSVPGVHALGAVAALFAVVLLCYGGGFGTMPAFTADYFGTRHLGAVYGWILLAWGVGGVVGPVFVALVKDRTGTFAGALPYVGGLLLAATVLPVLARRPGSSRGPGERWAHLRLPRRVHAERRPSPPPSPLLGE